MPSAGSTFVNLSSTGLQSHTKLTRGKQLSLCEYLTVRVVCHVRPTQILESWNGRTNFVFRSRVSSICSALVALGG